MHSVSPLLHFAENELQLIALSFMAVVYALKIRWILRFPASTDRQPAANSALTNGERGARYSLLAVAMPWTMASERHHPMLYIQFVVFHLAVAASIAMSFAIPYAPRLMQCEALVRTLQVVFAAAAAIGVVRLVRRIADRNLRAISSPDDYFSLMMLIVWFVLSALAAPNRPQSGGEAALIAYFLLTAFFLIYVPFSKISHYLYYPFARWYLGRALGHRGVYPLEKGA
jgi:nitrate reductase gamma subunit